MEFDEDRWDPRHLYRPPPMAPRTAPPAPTGWTMGQRLGLGAMLLALGLIAVGAVMFSGSHGHPATTGADPAALGEPPTTADHSAPRNARAAFAALPSAAELHLSRPGAEAAAWIDAAGAAFDVAHPRPTQKAPCVADNAPVAAVRVYALASHDLYGSTILSVSDFGSHSAALAFAKAHTDQSVMDCLQQAYKQDLVALTKGGIVSEDSVTEANGFGIGSYGVQYAAQFTTSYNSDCGTQYRHVTWTVVDTAVITGDFETCYSPYNFQDEQAVVTKIETQLKTSSAAGAPGAPGAVPTTRSQLAA